MTAPLPDSDPDPLAAAGRAAGEGRFEDALAACRRALEADPANPAAWTAQGTVLAALGRMGEAVDSHAQAEALAPGQPTAVAHHAIALQQAGRLEAAVAAYRRLLALAPGAVQFHLRLAESLHGLGRFEEAVGAYERALSLDLGQKVAWSNRGAALEALDRLDEALESYDFALHIDGDYVDALNNRGVVLRALNRPGEAVASFERAEALDPGPQRAMATAECRLFQGDWGRGLVGHENRWLVKGGPADRREYPQPLWLGEEDIRGKTLLLHFEQGFGDTLQFCRYASLAAERGARVILEAQRPLLPLLRTLEGVDLLVAPGDPLPEFDLHCPLASLPLAFRSTPETVPYPDAYLAAPEERTRAFADLLGPQRALRVGIGWFGGAANNNDHNRSIPLAGFVEALPSGVEVVSLHDRVRSEDAEALAAHPEIRRFDAELKDFADTAALASLMDVVLAVDTSVAHLAGAIGVRTWLLLPFAGGWRWLLDREDTPWYRGMRLFRQDRPGEWGPVLRRIRSALATLAAERGPFA